MNWNPHQNDPYSSRQSYPSYGAQGPYAQSPYGHQPPPRSGSGLAWLWTLLGVGGGLFLLCCGGCIAAIFFGMNVDEQELKERLADNPVIVEHIGKIVALETDVSKSFAEDDMNTFYYRIVGTVGEGELIVQEESGLNLDEEQTPIEWAKLRLDSGEEFDVLP